MTTSFRKPPKGKYNGITIIMSNRSRFDISALLTGNAGTWFKMDVLWQKCRINWVECDLRLMDDKTPFEPGTVGVLLLGSEAYHQWSAEAASLGEQRGYPLSVSHLGNTYPAIATYQPQDAWDVQDYESVLNPFMQEAEDEGEDAVATYEGKGRKGRTSRSNWRYWLTHDVQRLVRIVRDYAGTIPAESVPAFELFPPLDEVISVLDSHKDSVLYIDIETDMKRNLNCVGFMFPDTPVYVVPIYDHTNILLYSDAHRFFAALSRAFVSNVVVAHNGSSFDFPVLAMGFRLAPKKVYDTMVAQARIYPKLEKSLGHCLSMWSWQRYHKDDGILNPQSQSQCTQLWTYNARDVFSLKLIHEAQLRFASGVAGLRESIDQANASIIPYMTISLQGIRMEEGWIDEVVATNDRLLNKYLQFVEYLVGYPFLPTSSQQCVKYFHDALGYDVISRSKKTNAPSLGEEALLKLKLKYPHNPVMDLVLAIRSLVKESGSLKFSPLTDHWIAPCYRPIVPETTSQS